MKIDSINSLIPIIPITPVKKRRVTPRKEVKKGFVISDDNLGKNVDITIQGPLEAPNCRDCISYYVTWDPAFPHGCKMFNYKRWYKDLPAWGVYEATGCHCPVFEQNQKIKK
jgi:hypothetical protein